MVTIQSDWKAAAKAKVEAIKALVPANWILSDENLKDAKAKRQLTGNYINQWLDVKEVEIINLDSKSLVERLRAGILTALEVTEAYCHTAAIAYQINNCLHEIMFSKAITRAKELDAYFKEHGKTMGPLHGLPISLKDQFHVKGFDTTMGYVGWIDTFEGSKDPEKVRKVESQLVQELLGLGAVLYVKTSMPQTVLFDETINNIIGTTMNPVNMNLSPGGSSGGEGALIALQGSSLGVGTDIAGSVRVPAAFCGIYGIKPTHDRFSYRNVANTNPGQTTHPSSIGFLSSSLDGLKLMMTSVLSTKPWIRDPTVIAIPWRQDIVDSVLEKANEDGSARGDGLAFGLLLNDGEVTPHPPILRGLALVEKALKHHQIRSWNPPSHAIADHIHQAFLSADGAHDIHTQLDLSGEPLIEPLRDSERMKLKEPMGLLEYQELTLKGKAYCEAYSDYWNSMAVDAVLMPVAPHAAVIPDKFYHLGYTESISLLDYSVIVIPVSKADMAIDLEDKDYQPMNKTDEENMKAYDPTIYHDAPVGLQIVTRKHEEEKAWAIAKVVMAALKTVAY